MKKAIIKYIKFDMNYFLQPGVDINGFDPAFKKYYNRVFGDMQDPWNYIPTNPLKTRDGVYSFWTQTSPEDGAWVFKFNTSNFNTTPYLAPFLKDSIKNDEIYKLQYNKDIASAYGILAGEIKTFDSASSGTVANQFTISPKVLGSFMGKVASGLKGNGTNGPNIKAVAMPVENIKWFQFTDDNSDMYADQLTTSAGVGSGVSRIIYSSDRMSSAEIEAGITDQYNTMKPLYYQFENFLDFYANKLTRHYKFKFSFDGCSYQFDREKRFDRLMKLADKGMVMAPSAWASAIGVTPMEFQRSLEESKWSNWSDTWQLLLNANTSSGGESAGRPKSDSISISDSGENNRNV